MHLHHWAWPAIECYWFLNCYEYPAVCLHVGPAVPGTWRTLLDFADRRTPERHESQLTCETRNRPVCLFVGLWSSLLIGFGCGCLLLSDSQWGLRLACEGLIRHKWLSGTPRSLQLIWLALAALVGHSRFGRYGFSQCLEAKLCLGALSVFGGWRNVMKIHAIQSLEQTCIRLMPKQSIQSWQNVKMHWFNHPESV